MSAMMLAVLVVRLSNTDGASVQELATVARSVADVREVSVNAAERAVSFNGTDAQNAIAEWVVPRLDVGGTRPVGSRFAAGPDDVVRVFYPESADTVRKVQEIATVARSLAEIRRTFVYNPAGAIVARGTAEQIAIMEWLVPLLDVAGPRRHSAAYRAGGRADDVSRVFYLGAAETDRAVQELTTAVRVTAEILRAFVYSGAKALAVRATAEQVAAAEFLIEQLNVPAGKFAGGKQEYRMPGQADGFIRLLALRSADDAAFQQRAKEIRVATGLKRAFTYAPHRVLVVRGTEEQVAQAARLAAE